MNETKFEGKAVFDRSIEELEKTTLNLILGMTDEVPGRDEALYYLAYLRGKREGVVRVGSGVEVQEIIDTLSAGTDWQIDLAQRIETYGIATEVSK